MALKKQSTALRICSPQLGLSSKSILGGEVFDREILIGLAKQGIEIEIILPRGKPHDKVKNWNIACLPIKHFPAILGNFLYLPYIFKAYKNNKFQILRIHQPQFLGLGSLIFKMFNKDVKLVATYHQFGETKFWPFSKFINNQWNHIFCDSENVQNKIVNFYGVPKSKITVVHNGTPNYLKPTEKDQKLVKKLKIENKFVLLFMGLFIERKNPMFLIGVLKRLAQKDPNVALLYWGEGPLKKQILQAAKSEGLVNSIRFIPPKYGPAKNKIHNLADIFLHPSLDEGFALAPLEAMACAKPIIMNNSHSSVEAVENGKNGYMCKTNNISSWFEKIQKLRNNKSTLYTMEKYSLEKSKKEFSWDECVKKHINVFKQF